MRTDGGSCEDDIYCTLNRHPIPEEMVLVRPGGRGFYDILNEKAEIVPNNSATHREIESWPTPQRPQL